MERTMRLNMIQYLGPFFYLVGLLGPPLRMVERARFRKFRSLSPAEVVKRSEALRGCELYHFQASPFAARVRGALAKFQVEIPMHDVLESNKAWKELIAGGKRDRVPCLKVTEPGAPDRWIYESLEIVKFIEIRMAKN